MYQIILVTICKHTKDQKVTGSSQVGFMKGKSCMKNLRDFCNEMAVLVHEGREVNVIYLHLGEAFDIVFHNTLTDKLMKHGLEKWTARWIENCL